MGPAAENARARAAPPSPAKAPVSAAPGGAGPHDDATLVARARSGDAAAFRAIYDRYAPRLYGLCVSATGDRATGGDLLQEVFLQVHRHLAQLERPERLREWLFAIAMNAVRAHAGGEKRRHEVLQSYRQEPLSVRVEPEEAAQPLLRELRIQVVRETIAQVKDPRERVLLTRYYADEREPTTRELAAELGMPPGSVTVTLMRARARIARRLFAALAALDGSAPPDARQAVEAGNAGEDR
jgi:RNA polymerase sigma factor (sigma-70 family)